MGRIHVERPSCDSEILWVWRLNNDNPTGLQYSINLLQQLYGIFALEMLNQMKSCNDIVARILRVSDKFESIRVDRYKVFAFSLRDHRGIVLDPSAQPSPTFQKTAPFSSSGAEIKRSWIGIALGMNDVQERQIHGKCV
ncbi:hypothetical protein MesoLj113a_56960 [Mesorhizobium sp. 113-1-2]|nr:Uncharacterized protein MLTONO_6887 [Mesorhizobium loti]BCG74538.1 hypothetical protein MesoLj113a_56960 [Mesorhizobium sp. 113-1-2]